MNIVYLKEFEFNVLLYIKDNKNLTQRTISSALNFSLGKTNKILKLLLKNEFVQHCKNSYYVTKLGNKILNKYKVKNAIIMAAGMSTRFAPLAYEKPKGLLNVKGQILIERQIEQLNEAGINDIYIVVGYMKEQFFYLEDKYKGVHIIVNEDYYKYNNPSTLIRVTKYLKNSYICSSDNYFVKNPFTKYVYRSYYSAEYVKGKTNEYCLVTNKKGRIIDVNISGKDSWYMIGHVYFNNDFSKKFINILKSEYDIGDTKYELWENLLAKHLDELEIYINKYEKGVIKEFDNLDELREFDRDYVKNSGSSIFKHINKILNTNDSDIKDIFPIKTGLTNSSFHFSANGKEYVYRHPGVGTEVYINRKSEEASMTIAKKLKLDETYIYMDKNDGWKISKYIKNSHTLDYHNIYEVKTSLKYLKKLHNSSFKTKYRFDVFKKIDNFIKLIKNNNRAEFLDINILYKKLKNVKKYVLKRKYPLTICHCDSYSPNFLFDKNKNCYLIDWEYSGMSYKGCDLGTFIACSDYNLAEAYKCLEMYTGHKLTNDEKIYYILFIAIMSFYWFVWALYQDSVGKTVGEYLYIWYRYSKLYLDKSLELIGGK